MEKQDVIDIAEGLKMIEEGVEKIQKVMREKKPNHLEKLPRNSYPCSRKTMMKLMIP